MKNRIPPADFLHPDWSSVSRVHNWKNYIEFELREIWDTFTDAQKLAIADNAQEIADREEWE